MQGFGRNHPAGWAGRIGRHAVAGLTGFGASHPSGDLIQAMPAEDQDEDITRTITVAHDQALVLASRSLAHLILPDIRAMHIDNLILRIAFDLVPDHSGEDTERAFRMHGRDLAEHVTRGIVGMPQARAFRSNLTVHRHVRGFGPLINGELDEIAIGPMYAEGTVLVFHSCLHQSGGPAPR